MPHPFSRDSRATTPAPALDRRRFLIALGVAGIVVPAVPAIAGAAPVALAAWSNPALGTITSGYKTPSRPTHAGTDVANSSGTSIYAASSGTVAAIRTNSYPGDTRQGLLPGRTGNGVIINHADGRRTYYGHLLSVSVSVGQSVTAGQRIAAMGTTGNSTGPHLHFEVHVNGSTTNPYTFLSARGITLGSTPPAGGGWPTVTSGARSETVKVVQHLLTHRGHSLVVDGHFGSVSVAAAKAFQKAKGLVADGVVGPVTWPHLVVTLRQGASGSAVKGAQVGLNRHGHGLLVDGDFGGVTTTAVRSFQKTKGLVVDGEVGPITWSTLV